jgi:hypothetical protein
MARRQPFSNSRVVIAEGEEDAAFVRALLAAYSNLPPFDVSPTIDVGQVGGSSGFETAIMAADAFAGFSGVSDVVIVADNDDPAISFNSILQQLQRAKISGNLSRNWGEPTAPMVKAPGDPSVSVWLWPGQGRHGCLETLLWQAVKSRYRRIAACVDQAIKCANIGTWPVSKLDKARVRIFIALTLRESPAMSLARLWSQFPNLIPVKSSQFREFLQFIRTI